jgi:hypothetical protein
MMEFDRSPAGPSLDPAMMSELRAALLRAVQSGRHDDQLYSLLGRAAAEARQKGLQAEQLLVMLKELWYSLPAQAGQPGSDVQSRLLQQLIARSIREYYAT